MKNLININNYEEFALDYMEGNLDDNTKSLFEQFLNDNPEVKEELEGLLDFTVLPDEVSFELKLVLKKSEIEDVSRCEYLCISDIEGTITKEEKSELENIFSDNPELLNDYKQFVKTKLEKDYISYPFEKYKLKQSGIENLSYVEYLFISKLEGTLTSEEEVELEKIIESNSELRTQNNTYSKLKLQPEKVSLPFSKLELKTSDIENISYIDNLIIAKAEGVISEKENKELEQIISGNKKLQSLVSEYQNLKLKADESIVYPNKKELKRSNVVNIRRATVVISTLAAMLIVFFGVKNVFNADPLSPQFERATYFTFDGFQSRNIFTPVDKDTVTNEEIIIDNTYDYQMYAEEKIVQDTIQNENIIDDIYIEGQQVFAFEEVKEKKINTKLTVLKEHKRRYANIPMSNYYDNSYDYQAIAAVDESSNIQKVVNFVVNQYNTLTENDVSMKVDIDKENKCYGLEINEKNYEICLEDKSLIKLY